MCGAKYNDAMSSNKSTSRFNDFAVSEIEFGLEENS